MDKSEIPDWARNGAWRAGDEWSTIGGTAAYQGLTCGDAWWLRIANCELRGAVGRLPSCTCRQGCRGSEARWHEEMRLRGSLRERQGTSGSRCRRSEPEGEVATRKRRTTLAAGHVDGCICNQPANTSEGSCACAMLGLALDLPFRLAKGSKGCPRRLSARVVEDE
jgi:hypothetical protein